MNLKYLVLFLLALLGCSGGPLTDEEEREETLLTYSDYGQVQQAFGTVPNGYGWLAAGSQVQNRCWVDSSQPTWPGGKCAVPFMKTVNVIEQTSTCTGPYAADYTQAMLDASLYLRGRLQANGFTVFRNGGTRPPAVHITMQCGSPFAGSHPNSTAGTSASLGNCVTRSQGQLCTIGSSQARLFKTRFEAIPGMASWTSSQRRTAAFNRFAHEAGHGIGLGHDLCGTSPLADLMGNGSCQGSDPATFYNSQLTQVEQQWLSAFNP